MALSKKMEDLVLDSDAETENFCAACALDGEYRLVVKFCLDCSQPICRTCVDSHRRIKQIQNHKLVDNKNEDSLKHAKMLSSCIACPSHAHKTIEFICVDDDVFCCSTCATANHRHCRQVKEVAEIAQRSADVTDTTKHLTDANSYLEELIQFRQKCNAQIQDQVIRVIPAQIRIMKASVMETFHQLEKLLQEEARSTADIKENGGCFEIAKWQSHIETVKYGASLLSVTQENGTNVHKYIAAKTVEKSLADIDNAICQARSQLKSDTLSFSFDKGALLRNAYVIYNNDHKSLADIGGPGSQQQQKQRPGSSKYPMGSGRVVNDPFAKLSVVTKPVTMRDYPYARAKPDPRKQGYW